MFRDSIHGAGALRERQPLTAYTALLIHVTFSETGGIPRSCPANSCVALKWRRGILRASCNKNELLTFQHKQELA
jgi:hypothetical protein